MSQFLSSLFCCIDLFVDTYAGTTMIKYFSFIFSLEMRLYKLSNFSLLSCDCIRYSRFLHFYIEFKISLSTSKKKLACGIMIGTENYREVLLVDGECRGSPNRNNYVITAHYEMLLSSTSMLIQCISPHGHPFICVAINCRVAFCVWPRLTRSVQS